jgi:hypothetical protein
VLGATLSLIPPIFAAPIAGFEQYYNAVLVACTAPVGNIESCTVAINEYAGVLVGSVELPEANESFSALRSEVYDVNDAIADNEAFRDEVDDLFELLLPDSGAVGTLQSLV